MILVGAIAAVLWGMGHLMGTPKRARWLMLALLYVLVLAIQIALPAGHALRTATGESPALWLILGGFGAMIYGYRRVLSQLRRRAQPEGIDPAPAAPGPLTDSELTRYSRHIILREIGGPGQRALKDAKVLIVGAGGLGAPIAQYLGAAGVGTLGIIDHDVVEASNLHRQVIHRDDDIGMPKVFSAQSAIAAQNPYVTVRPYHRRLTHEIAQDLLVDYDLVLDGSDNFETRYLVNAAASATGTPLISGALTQWEGQLALFDPARGSACYQCVFPEAPDPSLAPPCAEAGVIGPLPGIVGSMMALEAIKHITGAGTPLRDTLLIHDALHGESRRIGLKPRPDCPICHPQPSGDPE